MTDGNGSTLGGQVTALLVSVLVIGSVAAPAVAAGQGAGTGSAVGADVAADDVTPPESARDEADREDDHGDGGIDRGGPGDEGDDGDRRSGVGDDGDTGRSDLNDSEADDAERKRPDPRTDGPRRTVPVGSVPALDRVHTLEQPNGIEFEARQWGDAWNHGWETLDGHTIVETDDGYWAYARLEGEELVPTGRLVGIHPAPAAAKGVRPPDPETYPAIEGGDGDRSRMTRADLRRQAPEAVPSTGTANFPVVMINFTDTTVSYSTGQFQSLLFGDDPAIASGPGSVTDYYDENSYGQVTVTGDVVGWVTADHNQSYYGEGGVGDGQTDYDADELVLEAAQKVDARVDFSQYDNNDDGVVDQFVVVHQGAGQEVSGNSEDIWSHKYFINYVTNDGVRISGFTIQPEEFTEPNDRMATIGVFAHELGHAFGLPDLYDIDYTSQGAGVWAMMAAGPYNQVNRPGDSPAHFTAWSKQFLGWIDPPTVTDGESESGVTLDDAATNPDYYQVLDPANNTLGQYFLVANRQQVGFDRGLPGEGILITDINRSRRTVDGCIPSNTCNKDETNKLVDVEAADGNDDLDTGANAGNPGDLWTNSDFTPDSTPSSDFDNGTDSDAKVYSIGFSGDTADLSISVSEFLTERWSNSTPGRSQYATPALGPDRVVMAGLDGTVRAVYRANGTVDWTFDRAGSLSDSSPAIASGRVFVGSGGGKLYALDLETGDELWNHSTDSAIVSSPAVGGGTVYVGANDGEVMALDASSGGVEWSVDVGAPVYSSLAADAANGTVYVTTDDGSLLALNTSNGDQRWSKDVGEDLGHSSPVLDGGDVYVAGDRLYRVNPDGTQAWASAPFPSVGSSPLVYGGSVYVGSANGKLYAFRTDGTFRWAYNTSAAVGTTPAAVGSRIVVGNDAGELHVVETSGSPVGTRSLGARIRSSPVISSGVVYVGSGSGTLWVLENL